MALLQISEPDMSASPHQKNIALGIDLGTTNSLVATIKSGEATVLCDTDQEQLLPSVVYYAENNQVVVGSKALANRIYDPANTIISVKRFMGQSFKDLDHAIDYPYNFINKDGILEIETRHGRKNPVQISAAILTYLKNIAIASLGEEPVAAVITVPAYFNDSQRQATKHAAELAGLNVLRLLNEPTAAAIAYGLDSKQEGTFLVYDLGGGTLDVSILKLNRGLFEVLAVNGDTYLGGDDFDRCIYRFIVENAKLSQLSNNDIAKLMNAAKLAKEQLLSNDFVNISSTLNNGQNINLTLSQEQFVLITQDLIRRSQLPIKKVLHDANLTPNDIDEIIMVGGSTRLKIIRDSITQFFNKPLLSNIDPDKVVAIGAAIQADILVGNRKNDWLLLDVTPLSLGIETMGGIVEKIIPRNSTIPITRAQDFTTYKDGQTAMSIHVVQGERELVTDCRSLAKFSLKGIPGMVAGSAKIRVTFQIDADGLLFVTAQEQTSKVSSHIDVKPSFGLTPEEIANMLRSSVTHAKDDILSRQLAEATIEANSLIATTKHALLVDGNLLTINEKTIINTAIAKLNQVLQVDLPIKEKTQQIIAASKHLNSLTENFATLRMNKALQLEITGKNINNL